MIIKASQRGGARNLANHLASTRDNDHVTVHEVRGLCGQSLHAALLEIEAVSHGTKCQQPMFSVSFNPPLNEEVSHSTFDDAFARLERKMGLEDQARVVVYHEKEGRRHAHVVWSRIDVDEMKSIRMSHFKTKCTELSRDLYLEHGWDMPDGFQKERKRDPFDLSNAEWQQCKRRKIDPRDIKALCRDAWARSDNLGGFRHALEEKGLFLCRGDKRGFVVLDHQSHVFSLTRYGGIRKKELEFKLGKPDLLGTVEQTKVKIRSTYNSEALAKVKELKQKHDCQMAPLLAEKAKLVRIQRAERRELADQQRVKRSIVVSQGRARFRRGLRGIFDKVSGRNRRVRLINQKETMMLKQRQQDSREKMIFRHNLERSRLQEQFRKLRDRQTLERSRLAERILWLKQSKDRDAERIKAKRSPRKDAFNRAVSNEREGTVSRGAKSPEITRGNDRKLDR
tara:strand:- start:782 stop:2140 length:1359 start_codon:yes stop_codon:yes gene_type:complete